MTLSEAMAAHQAGNLPEAERLYRLFLEAEPEHADAHALLGIVMGARGDFSQAIAQVNKAVALDPASGLLYFHQGTVLMAASKLPEAIAAFTCAVKLQPDVPQIRFNFANALRSAGDWNAAITQYREALRCDPAFLDAYNNLALSLVHEKQYEEALQLTAHAVAMNPAFGDGWLTLCNVAEKLKDYDTSLAAAKHAIELIPNNHYAWFGYGVALNRLNRDGEAVDAYTRALALNSQRADIWDNLAQTYQALNRLEEAEATYRKTVEVAGQMIANEESREVLESEYGNRHWHLALIELLRGKYQQGFARYRARAAAIPELKRLPMPFPLWCGEDLRGKSLLVCDEQGYGDTLMLARFLPILKAQGARIVFSVHKVLKPLLCDWSGADQVIAHEEKVPVCDYFCSSFDLPHRCGATLETLPREVPYIPVLPPDAATLLPKAGFKVGVVWGGSPLHLADKKRSIPLALFADLFSTQGVTFYNFNRDLKAGDAEILPYYKIENLIPRLTDFAASARLIGQMDLVITCDTATAHLAGALGKKTWVLLPFSPDWRWLTGRADSPWYPTLCLFRQPSPDDWQSVIAEVKQELRRLNKQ
jgi:tetratricopeptide (TPR) repeat protein/ADP-heptose:LPS heptosyltransferase